MPGRGEGGVDVITNTTAVSVREAVSVVSRSIRERVEGRWGAVRERGVRRRHLRASGGMEGGLLVVGRGMERSCAWRAVSGELG